MNIEQFLGHLDAVKRTGSGKWIAKCPGHDDRSPSLSIREADDGRILIRCWSGCSAADVMGGLGLSLADLFADDARTLSGAERDAAMREARAKATDRQRAREAIARAQAIIIACRDTCDDIAAGTMPTERTRAWFDAQARALLAADARIRGFDT